MSDRPFSSRAKKSIELAQGASAALGDEYVGTEHLLLGLLEEKTGPAAQMLNHLGVTTEQVRALVLQMRSQP